MSEIYSSDRSLAEKEQIRQEKYQPMVEVVEQLVKKMTNEDPEKWLTSAYRYLRKLEKSTATEDTPEEVREFVTNHLHVILEVLRGETSVEPANAPDKRTQFINERTRTVIHEVSDQLMMQGIEREPIQIHELRLESVVEQELPNGYHLKFSEKDPETGITQLQVYSPGKQEWFDFPLPPSSNMIHKGGFPRVVLKILAGAPSETIDAELPPNDFDVIAWGDESIAYQTAEHMGVDLSGVEVHNASEPNYPEWFHTRDIDLNCCFIGNESLLYANHTVEAAKSGHIAPIPSYRGLYGSNMLAYEGELLYTGRDMMRTVKFVAEGKATSFSFKELNKQIDMGIYTLSLTEKFIRKSNAEELLNKMFYLLKQTGQVHADEENIWDTLNRIHSTYPFMEVGDRELPDDTEISLWLLKKLGKQALKKFRSEYAIPGLLELERSPDDTEEKVISLEGYQPEAFSPDLFESQKADFIRQCRERFESSTQESLSLD